MRQPWLTSLVVVPGLITALGVWITASASAGWIPPGHAAHSPQEWHLTGSTADARRQEALGRAIVRIGPADRVTLRSPGSFDRLASVSAIRSAGETTAASSPIPCRFVNDPPSGTTPKFRCVFEDGETRKVKYGRNPEIHAEAAATRLVRALGFAADEVVIVPRLRCYGCPRLPFESSLLLSWLHLPPRLRASGDGEGYTDFDWVSVETRFPAPAITTEDTAGWAWWELKTSAAPRADLDALRLLAAFLEHWDNKAENQRLVCLDPIVHREASPSAIANQPCEKPLAMIQDLGATFGPHKVNLAMWGQTPIWADARACRVNVVTLPYRGATLPEVQISEGGRLQLARQLAALTAADVAWLFSDARFPQYYSATPDERDLAAWVEAFRDRVDQVTKAGPCPASN